MGRRVRYDHVRALVSAWDCGSLRTETAGVGPAPSPDCLYGPACTCTYPRCHNTPNICKGVAKRQGPPRPAWLTAVLLCRKEEPESTATQSGQGARKARHPGNAASKNTAAILNLFLNHCIKATRVGGREGVAAGVDLRG